MREPVGSEPGVPLQAFLYASGELEPEQARAFEARLADDQSAREALVLAVQIILLPSHAASPRPDPVYRAKVCQRLRGCGWGSLLDRKNYPGHPLLWGGFGAVAAVFLTLLLTPSPSPTPVLVTRSTEPTIPEPMPPLPAEPTPDVASVWADLTSTEHLARARDEEMRRRSRAEERSRVVRGEDHRSRVLHNSSPRR